MAVTRPAGGAAATPQGGRDGGEPAVLLLGGSPLGTRALERMGVPYDLVALPTESTDQAVGVPRRVTRLPFDTDPEAILCHIPQPDVVAAVSFTELGLWPASLLAREHGLRGVPLRGVALTRNKAATRLRLDGLVRQPRFGRVGGDPIPARLDSVVIKPVRGTASDGVVRLPAAQARELPADAGLLWEEYIPGPEVSVETVSRTDGGAVTVTVIGITAKQTTTGPYFVELGHAVPAGLDAATRNEVTGVVRRALVALGVTLGPAHTELKLTSDGPVLVEVQTRPGGGRIPALHEIVSGVDHYEAALRALLEFPPPTPRPGTCVAAAVSMLRAAPPAGVAFPVPEETANARVVEWEIWPGRPDDGAVLRSNLDRRGFLLVAGDDPREVQRLLDRAAGALNGGSPIVRERH